MQRLIDADALLEVLEHGAYSSVRKVIDRQPTVDAEPVVHAHWILEREPDGKPYAFHCSNCDNDFHHIGIHVAYDFCPNCGAKMDKYVEKAKYYYKLTNGIDEVFCTTNEYIKEDKLPKVICLSDFTAKEITKDEYEMEAEE